MGCLNCGKELIQTFGKRPKLYCNISCRSSYWQKQNKVQKEPGKPGRPKKNTIPLPADYVRIEKVKAIKLNGEEVPMEPLPECYLGYQIPKGLKGIDLTIWKAEIKEKVNKK